eukprot:SAG31_NODE_219_length_19926_cov_4.297297_7_plen_76_part_00
MVRTGSTKFSIQYMYSSSLYLHTAVPDIKSATKLNLVGARTSEISIYARVEWHSNTVLNLNLVSDTGADITTDTA